jgi:cytochrome P450
LLFGPAYVRLGLKKQHRAVLKDIKDFRTRCLDIIGERKKGVKVETGIDGKFKRDMLDILIEKQSKGGENAFTDSEIVDEFITFFNAGMDTTAHLVGIAIHYLSNNEQYREDIEFEMSQHYKDGVSVEELGKMNIMKRFLDESLRMGSPAKGIFYREAKVDHHLGPYKIKKGTVITLEWILNDFNTKYYDEPEKFWPERWLDENKKFGDEDNYVYQPFGAGPRHCIGQHFAWIESKIMMAEYLRRFGPAKCSEGSKAQFCYKLVYEPVNYLLYDLQLKN